MKAFIRVVVLFVLGCMALPSLLAQEKVEYPTFRDLSTKERSYYYDNGVKILPEAQLSFEKGEYGRAIMLCDMHFVVYGDNGSGVKEKKSLEAKSKKCYVLLREMKSLVSSGRMADAKEKARAILEMNPQDKAALEILNRAVKVTGVDVSPRTHTLKAGETVRLTATVSPADATNKSVVWSSSDQTIATVNQNGLVKGEKAGRVTITATSRDGSLKGISTINVTAETRTETSPIKVTGVEISQKSFSMEAGKQRSLSAKVYPENATNKSVVWSSSDPSVAKVNKNGQVTAVGKGTVTITVTTVDGSRTGSCTVTVTVVSEQAPSKKPSASKKERIPHTSFVAKVGVCLDYERGIEPMIDLGVYDIAGSRFGFEVGGSRKSPLHSIDDHYNVGPCIMNVIEAFPVVRLTDFMFVKAGIGYFSCVDGNNKTYTVHGMNAAVGLNFLIARHLCIDVGIHYYPTIQMMVTEDVTTAGAYYNMPTPFTVTNATVHPSIMIGWAF